MAYVGGTNGNDALNGIAGEANLIDGDAGNDTLVGAELLDWIVGDEGNDVAFGMEGNDLISAGAGDDTLYGNDGNDTLNGGDGNDFINIFGLGRDDVSGGLGADTLSVAKFLDFFPKVEAVGWTINLANGTASRNIGDATPDMSATLSSIEHVNGSNGADLITGDATENNLRGAKGADTIRGGGGSDFLSGGDQNDLLDGESGNDLILGDSGNDTLAGGEGSDILHGGAGDDSLSGGAEIDYLYGDAGNDLMSGGAGGDQFLFSAIDDGTGVDSWGTITDYVFAQGDRIDLSEFAGTLAFIGGQAFSGNGTGQVRLTGGGGNTVVHVDHNGDGVEDGSITLQGVTGILTPGADAFFL